MKFSLVTQFTPAEGSEAGNLLFAFIEQLRAEKGGVAYAPLKIIYPQDPLEKEALDSCLVEDSIEINKEFPYSEFLCMLHKLIRNK